MFSKQRWCICPPIRDSLEKEQQLKPKYVQETKTFGKVSGNQWHLRCARQEDSVDDDGDISISEASSSENEEEDGDDDDISITDQIPPPVLVQEDEERGGALSPWGNKCKAKQNIWRELDNKESSIHLMTVEQIHQRWAQKYPLTRFKNTFEAMKTQKRVYYQDDGIEPWKTSTTTSRAYDLLFKLFMDREKTKVHMMTVEQLMDSHDCFKPYGIEDFKGYIKDVDKRREMKKKKHFVRFKLSTQGMSSPTKVFLSGMFIMQRIVWKKMLMANNLVYFLTVLTIYFLLRPHNGSMKRFKESRFKKLQVIIRSLDVHPVGLSNWH